MTRSAATHRVALLILSAGRATPVNRHVKSFRFESFGDRKFCCWKIQIKNSAAFFAMKVNVLLHVRTKSRCATIHRDLPRQTAFHKRIEAIVNRCHRNLRHRLFRAHENLIRCWMITLAEQHVINLLPLLREPKAAIRQPRGQVALNFFISNCAHCVYPI